VPCVLAFVQWPGTNVTRIGHVHEDGCRKCCIETAPGSVGAVPRDISLYINSRELADYSRLQGIPGPERRWYLVCGGHWDDNLYWTLNTNNMAPSCGKCILRTRWEREGWEKKRSQCWFCPQCKANKCHPVFWT